MPQSAFLDHEAATRAVSKASVALVELRCSGKGCTGDHPWNGFGCELAKASTFLCQNNAENEQRIGPRLSVRPAELVLV